MRPRRFQLLTEPERNAQPRNSVRTRQEARAFVFNYIERLQSTFAYLSPDI